MSALCDKEGENIWLGLDLGTQSVRAVAVSQTGHVLGQGSYPLSSRRDGPRHEQDPEEWWRGVGYASRAAIADLPASSIRGVAVDGTSGTILLVDRSDQPLTPGLMYDDTRAIDESCRANAVGAAVWSVLGYRMQPSWALPKLLWLLREHRSLRGSFTRSISSIGGWPDTKCRRTPVTRSRQVTIWFAKPGRTKSLMNSQCQRN